ncbi:MAG: hypothetical protein L3J93_05835, partial [Thermoplasmata archaeon]|nr:hypothetical protein [Thermoplasmata archaeon]
LDDDGAMGYGRLEDNAAFASGLVELAGATADPRYARAADALFGTIDRAFSDPSGLFRDLAPSIYDGPSLPSLGEVVLPIEDAPHISPNATTALGLVRWSSLTGRSEPLERARRLIEALVRRSSGGGLFASGSALAAGLLRTPAARVVVEGHGAEADALARAAELTWHPNLWVFRGFPPDPFSLPEELAAARTSDDRGARALVCFGQRCLAPLTEPGALRNALEQADRPSA